MQALGKSTTVEARSCACVSPSRPIAMPQNSVLYSRMAETSTLPVEVVIVEMNESETSVTASSMVGKFSEGQW